MKAILSSVQNGAQPLKCQKSFTLNNCCPKGCYFTPIWEKSPCIIIQMPTSQPCFWKYTIKAVDYTGGKWFFLPFKEVHSANSSLWNHYTRVFWSEHGRTFAVRERARLTPTAVFCHIQSFPASRLERPVQRAVLHYLDRQSLRNSTVFSRSKAYQAKNIGLDPASVLLVRVMKSPGVVIHLSLVLARSAPLSWWHCCRGDGWLLGGGINLHSFDDEAGLPPHRCPTLAIHMRR